jgi:hypothetical protein
MSSVIDLLERFGRDSRLRHATSSELERELGRANLAPAVCGAILGNDRMQLESLLGAQPNVCCMIEPVEVDEGGKEDGN